MTKLQANILNRDWAVFEQSVTRVLAQCKTREDCVEVERHLRGRAIDIERLIDDGCYQRAFDLDNAPDEP